MTGKGSPLQVAGKRPWIQFVKRVMIWNTLDLNISETLLKITAAVEEENQDYEAQVHCFRTSRLMH